MNYIVNLFKGACLLACLFSVFYACRSLEANELSEELSNIETLEAEYLNSLNELHGVLIKLRRSHDRDSIMQLYRSARKEFKYVESLLSFNDKNNYLSLNQPNFMKVDEDAFTDIKRKKAFGFQTIEEEIVDEAPLEEIHHEATFVLNRINLIKENVELRYKNYHIFWIIRDQVVRVATLGLSGYDSPSANSLIESAYSYDFLLKILEIYKDEFSDNAIYTNLKDAFTSSATLLRESYFDSFDRYDFIKKHTHTQLELLKLMKEDWKLEFPFELAIYSNATSLFSDTTFNMDHFSSQKEMSRFSPDRAALGKRLFNDPQLSLDGQMSCATCHQKNKAFTDGLSVFEGQKRNTPALAYAGFQKAFFYDNRAGSLEGQIVGVVENEHEFHTDLEAMTKKILADSAYADVFDSTYDGIVDDHTIRNAIATYIRSLQPYDSKFDRNINSHENTLTAQEKLGFNVFMGKAQCATCHFPPNFNGTIPPYFTDSEMELIGVPESADSDKIDDDLGRYEVFGTEERKFFFKTPGIRNIALTAPYMHNGIYSTLDEVVEFYNHGGGVGMGMDLPFQTLPTDSLHLTEEEQEAIIAFMKTLTDKEFEKLETQTAIK
ncbi:MAG: methylamine utilization protein [Flavobacteriales bacterium]|nr:methylamine utilization protein [Flavobacteriales bacterium]